MARGLLKFKERELRRAARAVTKEGMVVDRVEIDPDGKIALIVGKRGPGPQVPESEKEWDRKYGTDPAA